MKNSKLLLMSIIALSSIILTSCNKSNNSSIVVPSTTSVNGNSSEVSTNVTTSANSNTQGGTSNNGTSNNATSNNATSASGEKYVVFCEEKDHVKITASAQLASANEVITLTIELDPGYEIDRIEVNNVAITGTSFVMPSRSAKIVPFVYLVETNGMMLKGDVSEALIKDEATGLYVARNVKCNNDTKVVYSINNKELSVTMINNTRTFADIRLPSDNKAGFVVAGGATYDFYYDPTDPNVPCFVKRVKVDLPQSAQALENLFGGKVKSETCVYPEGVTKVEYESNERNDRYVWELYSDNSSLATVKRYDTNRDKGIVYKSIDGSVYTVVDSYIEKHEGNSITYKEKDDSFKFAGKYDVVSRHTSGYTKYEYLTEDAIVDANMYSHTMESIDFDIMYAYRTGFENIVSDDIYTKDIKVTSTPNADGTFDTKVKSWVSVKKNGTASSISASYHNEYEVDLKFTEAGALIEVDYYHSEYDERQYDFERNKFKTGGEDEPLNEKIMHCKYTYGTKKAGKPNIDLTPYFVSSITDLKIVNSKGEDATVERMDKVEMFEDASTYVAAGYKYVSCNFEPSTALDIWQYGIVSSSDKTVINNRDNNSVMYPFEWYGNGEGTTTLKIGNHTKSTGVSANVDVKIDKQEGNIKSVWAYSVLQYDNPRWDSSKGTIYAGGKDKVKICATLLNNQYDQHPNVTITSEYPELLNVRYDIDDGYMYLDATGAIGITQQVTIKLYISASYAAGWGPSQLSVTIIPADHLLSSVVGEWDYYDPNGTALANGYTATLNLTDNNSNVNPSLKVGSLTVIDGKDKYVVTFDYSFDEGKQLINASNVKTTKNGLTYGYSTTIMFDIDVVDTGYIGVYCGISNYTQGEDTLQETIFVLCGEAGSDEEGFSDYKFENFAPKQ